MTLFSSLHRNLEPSDTLGEAIFGLIMVLTFTLGARLLDPEGSTEGLLIAALGCNIAWGIIDAFLYLLGCLFNRRRLATLHARMAVGDPEAALRVLRAELGSQLGDLGDARQRDAYYASIVAAARTAPVPSMGLTRQEVLGAITVFLLVALTAVPAALPFLIMPDPLAALRVSNAILIALLFIVGYRWGMHVGTQPFLAGVLIMSLGIAMVLVAISLGG